MNVVLWTATGMLAAVYLGAGVVKMFRSKDQLAVTPNLQWVADFSSGAIKGIGAAEVLGAVGITLPWFTGIVPMLSPVAAVGLVLLQAGAVIVHLRRAERVTLPVNIILLATAAFLAWGRINQL